MLLPQVLSESTEDLFSKTTGDDFLFSKDENGHVGAPHCLLPLPGKFGQDLTDRIATYTFNPKLENVKFVNFEPNFDTTALKMKPSRFYYAGKLNQFNVDSPIPSYHTYSVHVKCCPPTVFLSRDRMEIPAMLTF